MIELLAQNPVLLLFVVAALGYPLGRVRIGGFSLGVSAILFTGIAAGALDPRLRLPELVYVFGLVLFVYTVGLTSGSSFFQSLRRGLRYNLFAAAMIAVAAGLVVMAHMWLGLGARSAGGLFAGALTNTPALAGLLDAIKAGGEASEPALAEPVVAYALAYPVGVVGVIGALAFWVRRWRVSFAAEARRAHDIGPGAATSETRAVRVTRADAVGRPAGELVGGHGAPVALGLLHRAGGSLLADRDTVLASGDVIVLFGPPDALDAATARLGAAVELQVDPELGGQLDGRRVFMSNRELVGQRLRDLDLCRRFGATVTRVRRGDVDLIADGDTVLQLGDLVRVVGPRQRLDRLARVFGDSYRALSEIDIMSFGVGIALGLLLGAVRLPLPHGGSFRLGFAGGPLIVGLILGKLGRTGPLVWHLPYSANLTLRHIGLILFLAGVGTRSGHEFASTFSHGGGLVLFAAGAAVTCGVALLAIWVGYRLMHIPMGVLAGMVAGIHTQPAVLAFATEQTEDDLPSVGYASVYPLAMIAKIIVAQLLWRALS